MIEYRKEKGHDIVVVFDGWKGGAGTEVSTVRGAVKIIYSRLGEKADSVIKRVVSSDRREWIVVSSDRDIASHAWSERAVPVASGIFLQFIEKTGKGDKESDGFEEADDDPGMNMRRKGNPYRPSKKEKALQRALSKL